MPKGHTEGEEVDIREQLIGHAFHSGVLKRILEDSTGVKSRCRRHGPAAAHCCTLARSTTRRASG